MELRRTRRQTGVPNELGFVGVVEEALTANRLTKITTRGGDEGKTSLADGTRVAKNSVHMEAIGAVDELNSALGMLALKPLPPEFRELLGRIQSDLFDVGAELSYPGYRCLAPEALAVLDVAIEELNGQLPPLADFILPGGSESGALCHYVRALCRNTERRVVSWKEQVPAKMGDGKSAGAAASTEALAGAGDLKIPYLNRLSDLLFVLARSINHRDGAAETCWVSPARRAKK